MKIEDIIKELNNLRPTKEQVKDKPAYYAFGYVDAINSAIEVVKNNAVLPLVINCANCDHAKSDDFKIHCDGCISYSNHSKRCL